MSSRDDDATSAPACEASVVGPPGINQTPKYNRAQQQQLQKEAGTNAKYPEAPSSFGSETRRSTSHLSERVASKAGKTGWLDKEIITVVPATKLESAKLLTGIDRVTRYPL